MKKSYLLRFLICSVVASCNFGAPATVSAQDIIKVDEIDLKDSQAVSLDQSEESMFIQLMDPETIDPEAVIVESDNQPGIDLQVIIGNDDRTRVTQPLISPHIQVVLVESTFKGSDNQFHTYTGTGTLVGEDTVITAGHMLYQSDYGNAAVVQVYAGHSGTSFQGIAAGRTAILYPGYKTHKDEIDDKHAVGTGDDLGYIKLATKMGAVFGYLNLSASANVGDSFVSYGYPADKIQKIDGKRSTDQWKTQGSITSFDGMALKHNADTIGGQSGSALLNNSNQIIAINYAQNATYQYNLAAPITEGVIELRNCTENDYFPVYRAYNPNTGEHFYSCNTYEIESLVKAGWSSEGVAWGTSSSGVAVIRLSNPNTGEHHYTVNETEASALVAAGWKREQIAWYAPSSSDKPVYRLYNPNKTSFNHHYTTSLKEKNYLVSIGWKDEGIAWYAY